MGMRAKAAGAVVLLGGVLIAGAAMAKNKKKPSTPQPQDDNEDEELEENEVSVTTSTPTGEEAEIVMDTDELESGSDNLEEVLPEIIEDTSNQEPETDVDASLKNNAEKEGIKEQEAVSEVISEVTSGEGASELAAEETAPELDPDGTVALARIMLTREEMPGWKSDLQDDVGEWQESVGLKKDGQFGVKSAARMATEVGILPLIRYWPKDTYTKKQALQRYADTINPVINDLKSSLPDSQPQIDALTLSMGREKAQTWGNNNPKSENTREFVLDVNDSIAELAETASERELKNA